jgi:hypothetical protein
MERGGSYTYSTKILPAKPLTLETYYKKQSARKLAYLCVIFYQVYSPNVSGLRYWRSRICFWTHLVSSFISIVVLWEREDNEKKLFSYLPTVIMHFRHTSRILIKLLCSHTRIFPTMLCQIIVLCQLIAFPLCDHAIYQNANYICEALCPLHFFSFFCHCIAVHQ